MCIGTRDCTNGFGISFIVEREETMRVGNVVVINAVNAVAVRVGFASRTAWQEVRR